MNSPSTSAINRATSKSRRAMRFWAQCAKLEKEWGAKAHRIFYMATPPRMFGEIPKYLGQAGLARDREWARIVVEKPIGYDLESALALMPSSRLISRNP